MSAVAERPIADPERRFHMARRQAIIIELGAIEDYLGLERSIVPRRKREPADLREKFDRSIGYNSTNEKSAGAVR